MTEYTVACAPPTLSIWIWVDSSNHNDKKLKRKTNPYLVPAVSQEHVQNNVRTFSLSQYISFDMALYTPD